MIEIIGQFNTAKFFASTVGDNTAEQIKAVCGHRGVCILALAKAVVKRLRG